MARPRNTTDTQILYEARACFLEHGAAVSTTVIAERLGISHGVLFQRFGTKDQLLRAALLPPPPEEQPWMARVRSGPDERDVRDQLAELAEEISTFLARIVPCLSVLRSAGMHVEAMGDPGEELPPVRVHREITGWFSRAMARGLLRAVQPEHAAELFLGSLQFRPFHLHVSNQGFSQTDSRAYREFVVDLFCRTLVLPTSPP